MTDELAVIERPRSDSLGPILPLATPDAMREAMNAYAALKAAVLTENDEQEITVKGKKRKFVKRSGWRRLSIAFGVSTTILDRKITVGPEGRTLSAEFTVRATAPNGRFADGWGACSAWEERFQDDGGRRKMEHDIPATAETRAENRAASNLFGYGEVSAEEMEDSAGVARPTCPKCGKFVRESGFTQGEWYCWTKQGGCGWKGSDPVLAETGEISAANASVASREAVQSNTLGVEAAPSLGGPTPTAAVATPPAPSVNQGRSVGPSGPRAKRGNVVTAPQEAPTNTERSSADTRKGEREESTGDATPRSREKDAETGATPRATAVPSTVESAPPVARPPLQEAVAGTLQEIRAKIDKRKPDSGEEAFLATLRQQARESAAVLRQLRVRLENVSNEVTTPLPPATPNSDSDASLDAYISDAYGKDRTLASLNETELAAMLGKFEELTKRVEAKLR